jgi:uncharacterized protein YdhG (YjbR/CyaY superfamily)
MPATLSGIDAYMKALPAPARAELQKVRAAIAKALPRAEEAISYAIPAFKIDGSVVIFFAAWKDHYAIYPASEALVAAFAKQLAPYDHAKGTIRFPYAKPPSAALIGKIAKFKAAETAARAAAKKAKKPAAKKTGAPGKKAVRKRP